MGYVTRRFVPGDDDAALVRLWADNMSTPSIAQVASDRIEWLYRENPLGPAVTWLAVDDATHEVVGCASLCPRNVSVRGQSLRAGIGMDLAITRKHRIGGAAVMLQRSIRKEHRAAGFDFTFTYPNKGSLAVVKRVGFVPVCDATHWVKPVRSGYKLERYVGERPSMRVAAFVVDRMLGIADRRHVLLNTGKFRGEITGRADERFDALWARTKGRYALAGERSSAWLNWRYTRCRTAAYSYFILTRRSTGEMTGFVVFEQRENKAFVADVYCQDLGNTLSHLMVGLCVRARRMKLDAVFVAYAGADSFRRRLLGLDFIQRDFHRAMVVGVDDRDMRLKMTATDPQSWIIFDGELDL